MSRHRAYQNYDYEHDLDEYDGEEYAEEEEDELSPEDKVRMAEGTAEVRRVLATQADMVTTNQIQEALWHYYYDVDKSVAYLINKFIDPAPKTSPTKVQGPPPKQKDSVFEVDRWRDCAIEQRYKTTLTDFFADMPWLNIPDHRRTVFVAPARSSSGLLGGSSGMPKMSKLQALAAARKKKTQESKKAEELVILPKEQQVSDAKSIPVIDARKASTSRCAILEPVVERMGTQQNSPDLQLNEHQGPPVHLESAASLKRSRSTYLDGALDDVPKIQKSTPSTFAQTLLPFTSGMPLAYRRFYPLPWMLHTTVEALQEVFEKPSPDDIVLAAQSQAGKKAAKPSKAALATQNDHSQALKIAEVAPLPKSRNLNVIQEYAKSSDTRKKSASFVVVGHVDSGKSTLLGRLLLDMKVVDQRTIDKYRKEAEKMGKSSFALAWVLDSRTEERSRGVTIDIAKNHFNTPTTSFTLLDAPGHRDFIPNMLAGAGLADFAVLVVDAAKGAFEAGLKGQTREHALLLRSMGVFRIIIAINKLDTSQWDKERFDEIRDQVLGALKALKFPAKDISFVPVSGLHGDNIAFRCTDSAASWYNGPTLLEELERSEPASRELEKPLRMMITGLWDTTLSPVTVSGRIDAGTLQVGDAVLLQPSAEKAYIKSVEVNEEPAEWAVAGQHVTLYLSHIDETHVHIGDVISSPSHPIPCVDSFIMKALAFDSFFPMPVDLHRGRLHTAARISELTATLDIHKGSITKKKPQIVKAGSVARIVVSTTDGRIPLEKGDRVVLRNGGDTIAAGLIE